MRIRTLFTHGPWYALAAVLTVVACGVELDRESQGEPGLAMRVPGPFRAFAQQQIAAREIQDTSTPGKGDPQQALAEARELVRRRPIPGENLFLLGLATYQSGNQQDGIQLMNLSGERGWRVPLIQQTMVRFAFYNKANDAAAARILALWSIDADGTEETRVQLTRQLLEMPEGAEAFGKFIAASLFQQKSALRATIDNATPDQLVRVVQSAQAHGARLDCTMLKTQAQYLAQRRLAVQARALADAPCRAADE